MFHFLRRRAHQINATKRRRTHAVRSMHPKCAQVRQNVSKSKPARDVAIDKSKECASRVDLTAFSD